MPHPVFHPDFKPAPYWWEAWKPTDEHPTVHYPQMIGVTVALSITYPDGTVAKIPEIPFGEIVLVGWSETQLLAVDPTPDPDWHQNRTYLRVQAT